MSICRKLMPSQVYRDKVEAVLLGLRYILEARMGGLLWQGLELQRRGHGHQSTRLPFSFSSHCFCRFPHWWKLTRNQLTGQSGECIPQRQLLYKILCIRGRGRNGFQSRLAETYSDLSSSMVVNVKQPAFQEKRQL